MRYILKVLIVYDSVYGNTEQIARAIGSAFTGDVKLLQVAEIDISELESQDLLIIGAPTYGGRPTPKIKEFLERLPKAAVNSHYVAAFDTRFSKKWVAIFGYAAGNIAQKLKSLGGILVVTPEGFIVNDTKGPLRDGELQRSAIWAKGLIAYIK
jgi:flavodoxin I